MSGFNYRFSVIPAGAIIDARLTPRALQVLCLLGRHIDDNGWCYRSQVKMAGELDCGRSTIYDALELLVDAGWVEKRANGRGSRGPETSTQPFAAYSYRVVLDQKDREATVEKIAEPSAVAAEEGAGIAAGGAAQAAGGAGRAAPLEGNPSEGILPEAERDARARDDEDPKPRKPNTSAFNRKWPTASSDDQKRTKAAWDALPDGEWQACLDGIEPFLKKSKTDGRAHVIAGWRYIEEKRWTLLPDSALAARPQPAMIAPWSKEWWALLLRLIAAGKPTDLMLQWALKGQSYPAPQVPLDPLVLQAMRPYPSDGPEVAAWRLWLRQKRVILPEWRERMWIYLPSPEPPTVAQASTGPPLHKSA